MRRPILYPYRIFSGGAHALAEALDTVCVYPNGKYRPRDGHLIICWGAGTYPNWWQRVPRGTRILNEPKDIAIAINKLRTFEKLSRLKVRTPPWTTDRRVALEWQSKDKLVICRNSLTGSEGRGIIVADKSVQLPNCHLYTQHIRHKREFRVHVFQGRAIDIAEKRKRSDAEEAPKELKEKMIRSWNNGWVFCHENVRAPQAVYDVATQAVEALGLDFGAVDIGLREKEGTAYVFEVNTAPGIEGTTVRHYVEAVRRACNS